MKIDKTYLYSGAAILAAFGVFLYKRNQAKNAEQPIQGADADVEQTIVTPTGAEISNQQAILPIELQEALSLKNPLATTKLRGMALYTKVDNAKARYFNYVDDGFSNNVIGSLGVKGIMVGKVLEVVDDKGLLKSPYGRPYKWLKVIPTKEAVEEINKNKSWYEQKAIFPSPYYFFLREDVVTLNK